MSTTETLTRALLGALNTDALERSIVSELKSRYSSEELSTQLSRAAEILGCESPTDAIAVQVTQEELAALRTARDVLARL